MWEAAGPPSAIRRQPVSPFRRGFWDVPHARPSLSLDPDDAETETCGNQVYHVINVSNSGDEDKDIARGVTLNVSIVKGGQYVAELIYDPVIGDIPAGEAREFSFEVQLNDDWTAAEKGAKVKLRIEVTGEDNWPDQNIGRRAHFTIIKDCSPPAVEVLYPEGG